MQITQAFLADYANVTREGKLNVLGIFSVINAPSFPWVHPQMQLVFTWGASKAESGREKEMEIQLRDADGREIFKIGGKMIIPEGESGKPILGNQILCLNGVRFEKEGSYVFHILYSGEEKASIDFDVIPARVQKSR